MQAFQADRTRRLKIRVTVSPCAGDCQPSSKRRRRSLERFRRPLGGQGEIPLPVTGQHQSARHYPRTRCAQAESPGVPSRSITASGHRLRCALRLPVGVARLPLGYESLSLSRPNHHETNSLQHLCRQVLQLPSKRPLVGCRDHRLGSPCKITSAPSG